MSNVNPSSDATTAVVPQGIFLNVDPRTVAPVSAVPAVPVAPTQQFYTAEDLAQARETAREQEKGKLYPQLDDLKNTVTQLRDKELAREAEAQRLLDEKAEQDRKKKEDETDLRELFNQKELEWNAQLQQLKTDAEVANAFAVREREYSDLMQYKTQRIADEQDNIIPDLLEFVSGNTKDEIDASIASLVTKSNSMLEGIQAAQQTVRRDMPGTRVTAPSPMDINTGAQKQYTADDINKMSFSDWAIHRKTILSGQAQGQSQGLFGTRP